MDRAKNYPCIVSMYSMVI